MAQNDFFKRYLDAGLEFTALTQARAEALVKDLVNAGEVQADQARETVAELLERSRKSSERVLGIVRDEVKAQITAMGLASKDDVDRAEQRIRNLFGSGRGSGRRAASSTRKTAAKKATATKSTAKSAAKKSTAKKSTAKSAARKAPAKRATAKKSPAKATPAKKASRATKSTKKA